MLQNSNMIAWTKTLLCLYYSAAWTTSHATTFSHYYICYWNHANLKSNLYVQYFVNDRISFISSWLNLSFPVSYSSWWLHVLSSVCHIIIAMAVSHLMQWCYPGLWSQVVSYINCRCHCLSDSHCEYGNRLNTTLMKQSEKKITFSVVKIEKQGLNYLVLVI